MSNKILIIIQLSTVSSIIISLFLASCSSFSDIPLIKKMNFLESEESPPPPAAAAGPIDAAVIKDHHHLESYQGNLLLANERVQFVFKGIEPSVETQTSITTLIAAFEFQRGKWRRFVNFSEVLATPPSPTRVLAHDLQKKSGSAQLKYVFHNGDEALFVIAEQANALYVSFNQEDWNLSAHFRGAKIVSTTNTLVDVADLSVLTLVSSSPISREQNKTTWQASSSALLFGRNKFGSFYRDSCLPTETSEISHFTGCDQKAESSLKLNLDFEADSNLIAATKPHALAILDTNNQPLDFVLGYPGEKLQIPFAKESKIKIKNLSTEYVWGESVPIEIRGEPSTETINLSRHKTITVEVAALGEISPAFIEIKNRRIDLMATNFLLDSNLTAFSKNSFLIQAWPIELELLEGTYEIKVYRMGTSSPICRFSTNSKPSQFKCQDRTSKDRFLSDDKLLVNTTLPVNENNHHWFRLALQLDKVGIPVNANPAPRTLNEEPNGLTTLVFQSPKRQLNLKLFPVNNEDLKKWRQFLRQNPASLENFARFAREKVPSRVLQLGCLDTNLSIREYREILTSLKPDTVAAFGCPRYQAIDEQRRFLAKLFRDRKPLPILFANNYSSNHPFALYTVLDKSGSITEKFKSGQFTIAKGVLIDVKSFSVDSPQAQKRDISLRLSLTPFPGAKVDTLQIDSLSQKIYKESVEWQGQASHKIRLKFPASAKDRWFRILALHQGQLVGSTNFYEIK